MNEHNALNEDEMAEIETRAITDTATRWRIDEKLVDEIDLPPKN
jgi:signal recognition particle GTPase